MVNWRRGISLSWNWYGEVICHGSVVNWRRGWGQSVMKIMQCNGIPGIHVRLTGVSIGVAVCHVSVVDWRRGGVSLSWKLGSVMVFQISMLDWGGYIWHLIWTLHLKIWTHFLILGLSVRFIWKQGGISDSLSEHFIWKYELISSFRIWVSVCTSSEHFIWKWGDISESEHFIWKFGSQCTLHLKLGAYLRAYLGTSSDKLT